MSSPIQIMVVDDDERLRSLISSYLSQEGFEVHTAASGEEVFPLIHEKNPELIILDINLPGADGLSICRKLRHAGLPTPIIMLTARGDDSDRIHGLEIGADDYLTKPFNPRELVARMKAILRRQGPAGFALFETDSVLYQFAGYTLDLKKQILTKDDQEIHLSSAEFALLHLLVLEAGKPLSRDLLVARMASREHQPDQRSIDMLVSRLRKRLDDSESGNSIIRTLRGIGYIMIADVLVEKSL